MQFHSWGEEAARSCRRRHRRKDNKKGKILSCAWLRWLKNDPPMSSPHSSSEREHLDNMAWGICSNCASCEFSQNQWRCNHMIFLHGVLMNRRVANWGYALDYVSHYKCNPFSVQRYVSSITARVKYFSCWLCRGVFDSWVAEMFWCGSKAALLKKKCQISHFISIKTQDPMNSISILWYLCMGFWWIGGCKLRICPRLYFTLQVQSLLSAKSCIIHNRSGSVG